MPSSAYRELITSAQSHLKQMSLRQPAFFARRALPLPKQEPKPKKSSIPLEPIAAPTPATDSCLEGLGITKLEPPSDKSAKHIKESWRQLSIAPQIAVLIGPEQGPVRTFLQNLANAIDTLIAPARAIPAAKIDPRVFLRAEELKFIITTDAALTGNLLKYLREIPGQRFLKDKPLLLLCDPQMYLKDPMLKSALWKSVLHSC